MWGSYVRGSHVRGGAYLNLLYLFVQLWWRLSPEVILCGLCQLVWGYVQRSSYVGYVQRLSGYVQRSSCVGLCPEAIWLCPEVILCGVMSRGHLMWVMSRGYLVMSRGNLVWVMSRGHLVWVMLEVNAGTISSLF